MSEAETSEQWGHHEKLTVDLVDRHLSWLEGTVPSGIPAQHPPTMQYRTISVEFHFKYLFTNFCRLNRDAPPLNYKRLTVILEAMQSRRKIADSANTAAILFSLLSRSVQNLFSFNRCGIGKCELSLFAIMVDLVCTPQARSKCKSQGNQDYNGLEWNLYSWFWWAYISGTADPSPLPQYVMSFLHIKCHYRGLVSSSWSSSKRPFSSTINHGYGRLLPNSNR